MANEYPDEIISNWATLLENLEASPLAFYQTIEEGIAKRAVPDIALSRVDYNESGVLSAKREYLRITRGSLTLDICGAPYGTGFFVSWWLGTPSSLFDPSRTALLVLAYLIVSGFIMAIVGFWGFFLCLALIPLTPLIIRALGSEGMINDDFMLGIPMVGGLYRRFFKPDTYYAIDTATMFQMATHAAVLEAVDGLTTAKGIRALSESDRRPTLRAALKR